MSKRNQRSGIFAMPRLATLDCHATVEKLAARSRLQLLPINAFEGKRTTIFLSSRIAAWSRHSSPWKAKNHTSGTNLIPLAVCSSSWILRNRRIGNAVCISTYLNPGASFSRFASRTRNGYISCRRFLIGECDSSTGNDLMYPRYRSFMLSPMTLSGLMGTPEFSRSS